MAHEGLDVEPEVSRTTLRGEAGYTFFMEVGLAVERVMWRDGAGRVASASRRLALAEEVWGWKPHRAQARFFCCPAQMRIAACGRRWGKTESLSIDVASLALDERDCRQLVVAPTDAQARLLGNEVLARLLDAWDWRDAEGRPHPSVAGREIIVRQRPALSITLTWGTHLPRCAGTPPETGGGRGSDGGGDKTGGREEVSIHFRTAGRDGRGIRGLWAHRIVGDEAARIPDTVLTDVLLPMLADVGGDYVLASSPAGRRSAYYRMFAKGVATPADPTPAADGDPSLGGKGEEAPRPPILGESDQEGISYASFQCPTSDNPHIRHAFLEAQREELGEAMYAQEFGAAFVDDFGAVFRDGDIDAGIADLAGVRLEEGQIVSEPQPGRLYTLGLDWGRKLDYTVVAIVDATVRPARLVYLQRWQGTSWESQARQVGAICARWQPWRILADGNSIGDPLAETLQTEIGKAMREAPPAPTTVDRGGAGPTPATSRDPSLLGKGFGGKGRVPTVERFTFGAESKTRLIDKLTLGLSARAVQYPPHRVLLSELRGFEYGEVGRSGRAKMGARSGAHDDVVIALALAWWAAPEGAPAPVRERVLLGSSLGVGRRGA